VSCNFGIAAREKISQSSMRMETEVLTMTSKTEASEKISQSRATMMTEVMALVSETEVLIMRPSIPSQRDGQTFGDIFYAFANLRNTTSATFVSSSGNNFECMGPWMKSWNSQPDGGTICIGNTLTVASTGHCGGLHEHCAMC